MQEKSFLSKLIQTNTLAKYADLFAAIALMGITWWTKPEDGLAIAGVAAILVASRLITVALIEEKINPVQSSVVEIGKIIDISGKNSIREIDVLLQTYLSVTEEEFIKIKDSIVGEAIEKLRRVATLKTSEELGRGDYYQWLLPILDDTKSNDVIRAVSIMADAEWDDSPEEEKFVEGNVNAARNGALVERIFIVKNTDVDRFYGLEVIKMHYLGEEPKTLIGYVVEYDRLKQRDANLLDQAGHGFIDFNGSVALIDSFSERGEVRGRVTKNLAELKRIRETFTKLKNMSRPMTRSAIFSAKNTPKLSPPANTP